MKKISCIIIFTLAAAQLPQCSADIPTEALEALGRKNERDFRKRDTKRNRQKAAQEMVIEHPGLFDESEGVELNPEYELFPRKARKSHQIHQQRNLYNMQDDFIVFQQFQQQHQQEQRNQQGVEMHDKLAQIYDSSNTSLSIRRKGVNASGKSLFWFQSPSAAAAAAPPPPPIMLSLKHFFQSMYQHSPTTFWIAVACVIVFSLWQIDPMAPWLETYFVCSRQSARDSHGLSILLAAISHWSFRHLLFNLVLFFHMAPKLWCIPSGTTTSSSLRYKSEKTTITATMTRPMTTTTTTPLWPLFLGSILFSNTLFVAIRKTKSNVGLSGVVMAMMAYYYGGGGDVPPKQPLTVLIGGILPVSIQARQVIPLLFGISFIGSFSNRSTIAHLVHLGGLIFGLIYYHGVKRFDQWKMKQRHEEALSRTTSAKKRFGFPGI